MSFTLWNISHENIIFKWVWFTLNICLLTCSVHYDEINLCTVSLIFRCWHTQDVYILYFNKHTKYSRLCQKLSVVIYIKLWYLNFLRNVPFQCVALGGKRVYLMTLIANTDLRSECTRFDLLGYCHDCHRLVLERERSVRQRRITCACVTQSLSTQFSFVLIHI